jgi:flavorubredoxin
MLTMITPTLDTTAQHIAPDTWLIPTLAAEPSGSYFAVNSMVIRGQQPVVVDTGCALAREGWLRQVFSVVEPTDVRWIFVSHDDHDHIGNLETMLDLCPNATVVCNFAIVARLFNCVDLPLERLRWVDPGQTLDIGDRTLQVVRPPMFDSPATRGIYDPSTRLLWAVDSFGTFFPGEVYDAGDVPVELYEQSFDALNSWNTPWLEWVDSERYARHVRATADLPLDVVASAHGPVHRGEQIAAAFERTLSLAGRPIPPMPGQDVLDQLLGALLAPVA